MNLRFVICGATAVVLAACSSDNTPGENGDAGSDASAPTGTGGKSSTGGSSTGSVGGSSTGGVGGSSAGAGGKAGGGAADSGASVVDGGGTITYSGTAVVSLVGTLVDEPLLAGVEVCQVDATGKKLSTATCATTNAKGEFALELAMNQDAIIDYSKSGYESQLSAVTVTTKDIVNTKVRMPAYLADGGLDGGVVGNYGWDPSVALDTSKGTVNLVAVMPATRDGGIMDTGYDFTTGLSFSISPKAGDGPYYSDVNGVFVSSATTTQGGTGAWVLNLPPGTYTASTSSPTLSCISISDSNVGWAQTNNTEKFPVIAGKNTQTIAFYCAPKAADAGKD